MAVALYIGQWYVLGLLILLAIIALIIWVCVTDRRRRRCSDDKSRKCKSKKRKDSCKRKCSNDWGDWFGGWGSNSRSGGGDDQRRVHRPTWYSNVFWSLLVVAAVTGYNLWFGILLSVLFVIIVAIFVACSRHLRRRFCRFPWWQTLLLSVFGYLIGYFLSYFRCWFPLNGSCFSLPASWAVEYRNGVAVNGK